MATSSILENIRVNNPKAIEEFVFAMEASAKNTDKHTAKPESHVETDPAKIHAFMAKARQYKGIRK